MRDYAMYTEAGNDAVDAIVRTAKILKLDWPQVYNELGSLAERFPEDFGEATDTAVRESLFGYIERKVYSSSAWISYKQYAIYLGCDPEVWHTLKD